jgi:hypothetical protein
LIFLLYRAVAKLVLYNLKSDDRKKSWEEEESQLRNSMFERSPSAFLIKRKNPLKQFPGFFAPSHHQALITNKHKPTVQLLAWLSTAATG